MCSEMLNGLEDTFSSLENSSKGMADQVITMLFWIYCRSSNSEVDRRSALQAKMLHEDSSSEQSSKPCITRLTTMGCDKIQLSYNL